ncbi:MAG: hypothetical protein ABEJ89_05415 [Haloarculaceae archaeon]
MDARTGVDNDRTGSQRAKGAASDRDREDLMRAQTTLDFAVGISVFLAVILFVFLFVPGLLSPFTGGTSEETVLSNRVADQLVEETLGTPREPFVLERTCTLDFFGGAAPGTDGCRYATGGTLEQRVGVGDRQHLNVTVERNLSTAAGEQLCWDSANERLVERTAGACNPGAGDVELRAGDSPPSANDRVVVARRVVSLDGRDVTLYVRAW